MLLSPLGARAPRAIRMPADSRNSAQAALWYDDALATELHGGALDLALLGVGEDGHICVALPRHKALIAERSASGGDRGCAEAAGAAVVADAAILLQTKKIWLIAIGPRKLPVLQAAINKTSSSTPLDLLMRQAKDVTVFTDQTIRRR